MTRRPISSPIGVPSSTPTPTSTTTACRTTSRACSTVPGTRAWCRSSPSAPRPPTAPSCIEIAGDHPGIFAAVGVQPNHVAEAARATGPGSSSWHEARASSPSARPGWTATGTGRRSTTQQEWFDRHLALATELDLPVVIHCRDCEADLIEQLERWAGPSAASSTPSPAPATTPGLPRPGPAHLVRRAWSRSRTRASTPFGPRPAPFPLDRILVETDSPYLSPQPVRGRPNQPAHLAWTAQYLAEMVGLSPAEFANQTTANARQLFALSATDTL